MGSAPGHLDLSVLVEVERCAQALALPSVEEVNAGVQGPPRPVERFDGVAAVIMQVGLDPPAAVQCVAGEADDVGRVHDRGRGGRFLGGSGLEPTELLHRHETAARRLVSWRATFPHPGQR